ncbi:MAG: hypothetical protein Ta2B_05620 [Termitinemataceae bacterium]|nr:MAG: hypothetical protein Ta2B_05620 [Termitinemataceae bacterium]
MAIIIKKILFVLGLVSTCLLLVIVFFAARVKDRNQSSIFFDNPAVIENESYLTVSALVSVPTANGSAGVEFGTITVKLLVNESAYLQFSAVFNNGTRETKTTIQNNYLYDRDLVRIENGKITALKEGSTFLQIATNDGIKDVCYVMIKRNN